MGKVNCQHRPAGNPRGIVGKTPNAKAECIRQVKQRQARLTTPGGPGQEANEAKVKPQGQ